MEPQQLRAPRSSLSSPLLPGPQTQTNNQTRYIEEKKKQTQKLYPTHMGELSAFHTYTCLHLLCKLYGCHYSPTAESLPESPAVVWFRQNPPSGPQSHLPSTDRPSPPRLPQGVKQEKAHWKSLKGFEDLAGPPAMRLKRAQLVRSHAKLQCMCDGS